ncbi:MAG: hypothetical protein WDZ93_02570 [Candidatus Paceibacterota bacterium]
MTQNTNRIVISIIVLLIVAAGVVWYAWDRTDDPQRYEIPGVPQQVTGEAQNLEFTYYAGMEGYTLLESPEGAALGDPALVKAYTLVDSVRYDAAEGVAAVGSQMPAITILVFDEPEAATTTEPATGTTTEEAPKPTLREWAEARSGYTAYGLRIGEPEDARVDNVAAIRFTANGPFTSETYVLEYRGKHYVIIGQYEDEESEIRAAFKKLLTQIYFL